MNLEEIKTERERFFSRNGWMTPNNVNNLYHRVKDIDMRHEYDKVKEELRPAIGSHDPNILFLYACALTEDYIRDLEYGGYENKTEKNQAIDIFKELQMLGYKNPEMYCRMAMLGMTK